VFVSRLCPGRPWRKAAFALGGLLVGALLLGTTACANKGVRGSARVTQQGDNSIGQVGRYVQKAVRRSPEGFILIPSKKAERAFDRARLVELAQDLRSPAAACFINETIEKVQRGEVDGEEAWIGVPEGQAKIRVRIAPHGQVLRTDILEGGFGDGEDERMEACLMDVLKDAPWPENRSGNTHWVDAIYWVSLGFQAEDRSQPIMDELRRQQAMLALKGKGCLEGRTRPGTFVVDGLSLLDREGRTLVNRLEPSDLTQEVANCLAVVLRGLRMPRSPDSFVRPFTPRLEYTVAGDGEVSFRDERWLELTLLEERAERDARRAELAGDAAANTPTSVEDEVAAGLVELGPDRPNDATDEGADVVVRTTLPDDDDAPSPPQKRIKPEPAPMQPPSAKSPSQPSAKNPATKKPSAKKPATKGQSEDPGKGGLKLNLGARPAG